MTASKHIVMTFSVSGMTCGSCELLLERKLRGMPGILHVDAHHRKGTVKITMNADATTSSKHVEEVIRKAGYRVLSPGESVSAAEEENRKWLEIGASLLVIFAVYKLLQTFDLLSLAPSTSDALSLGGTFVIGLVAGASSCLAVTGGLLLALAAKHNELHRAEAPWQKFRPLLQFNIGRLVSYFVLGGLVGIAGQSITLSTRMSGIVSIAVALIMLWLALTILGIIPKGGFPIPPPKKLSHWIHNFSESDHPAAPFMLGAFTFFLPCGFTQSLQLVALASGNFAAGALIMSTFALGTLPSLLGLSVISSTAKGAASRLFLRFSGALVLLLAFSNLQSGLALTGFNLSSTATNPPSAAGSALVITGDTQKVAMKVTRFGYEPSTLTIKAGIPVQWMIDGEGVQGCTSQIVIPTLGITRSLTRGINEINFTAQNSGPLAFSCSMGMVRGSFNVL
ncbi:hypothetical protein EXS65_03345 [Candidatus Peribacteria bacterium]|nr:hypothetical protein [Candidatus Peribacteria bacterium]